jgi:hypothetical protein
MFAQHSRWAIGLYVVGWLLLGSLIAAENRVLVLAFMASAGTMRDVRLSRREGGHAMGWVKNLFGGETVELEYRDSDGELVKKRVPKAQFDALMDKAVAKGKATVHDGCVAHILDAVHGERTENWIVGEHVPGETYDRHKDSNGDLYVMVYYEKGEPQMRALSKRLWDQAVSQLAAISREGERAYQKTRRDLLGE